jgi:hypothetical protein
MLILRTLIFLLLRLINVTAYMEAQLENIQSTLFVLFLLIFCADLIRWQQPTAVIIVIYSSTVYV